MCLHNYVLLGFIAFGSRHPIWGDVSQACFNQAWFTISTFFFTSCTVPQPVMWKHAFLRVPISFFPFFHVFLCLVFRIIHFQSTLVQKNLKCFLCMFYNYSLIYGSDFPAFLWFGKWYKKLHRTLHSVFHRLNIFFFLVNIFIYVGGDIKL